MLEQEQSNEAGLADLWEYVNIAWRGKWFILIPAILGLILGVVATKILPEVYRSNSLILIEEESILNPLIENLAVSVDSGQRIKLIQQEILSWPKLVQLVETLGLDKSSDGNSAAYESLINHLKESIKVSFAGGNVLDISYSGSDPKQIQNIVSTLTDIIIQRNVTSQAEDADQAITFISKQLEFYRQKLEQSEEELRGFQEMYTVQLPVISRLNDNLVSLQVQLNTLLIENTESHPAIIALKKKIIQTEEDMKRESRRLLAKGIDVKNDKYLEIAQSIPKQQQEYQRLMRDRKVNESLYQLLLERFETAQISKKLDAASETTKFRIIEPARLPTTPISPDKPRIILLGFGLGLALGVSFVFLKELVINAYRNPNQLKKDFGLPILGAISLIDIAEPMDFKSTEQKAPAEAQPLQPFEKNDALPAAYEEELVQPKQKAKWLVWVIIVVLCGGVAGAGYWKFSGKDAQHTKENVKIFLKSVFSKIKEVNQG